MFGAAQALTHWVTGTSPVQNSVVSAREIDAQLDRLCNPRHQGQGTGTTTTRTIAKRDIEKLRTYLRYLDDKNGRNGAEAWSHTPLTYAILRNIGALDCMPYFRKYFNDFHLPYDERTLPPLQPGTNGTNLRQAFLEAQQYFLTDTKRIEADGTAEHFNLDISGDYLFKAVRMLGQGSFGGVDLVYSVLSLKQYARKRVLRGRFSERHCESQTFLINELKQLKRLSHKHLVKIVASYTDNEYISYLMEPVASCTLEQFLVMSAPLTPDYKTMLRTFYGCLAGAVNYLHQNKVRHRDLTARNMLIRDSQIYVGDFGSAYNWSQRTGSATRHHYTPVSPDYMAPEVAKREERDSKSDMFSLGVIFLEMTTRLLDHTINGMKGYLKHHSKKKKSNNSHVHANIPEALAWLDMLCKGNMVEHDNEPLAWVILLIQEKPTNRPAAKSLMLDILDSPSFLNFCCIRCHKEYEDRAFEYDALMHHEGHLDDSLDTRNAVASIFEDPTTGNSDSISQPIRHENVARWLEVPSVEEEQTIPMSLGTNALSGMMDTDESQITRVKEGSGVTFTEQRLTTAESYADWFGTGEFEEIMPQIGDTTQNVPTELARTVAIDVPTDINLTVSLDGTGVKSAALGDGDNEAERTFRDTGLGFQEWGSSDSEDETGGLPFEEVSEDSDTSSDDTVEITPPRNGSRMHALEVIWENKEKSDSDDEMNDTQKSQGQNLFEEVSDGSSKAEDDLDDNKPSEPQTSGTSVIQANLRSDEFESNQVIPPDGMSKMASQANGITEDVSASSEHPDLCEFSTTQNLNTKEISGIIPRQRQNHQDKDSGEVHGTQNLPQKGSKTRVLHVHFKVPCAESVSESDSINEKETTHTDTEGHITPKHAGAQDRPDKRNADRSMQFGAHQNKTSEAKSAADRGNESVAKQTSSRHLKSVKSSTKAISGNSSKSDCSFAPIPSKRLDKSPDVNIEEASRAEPNHDSMKTEPGLDVDSRDGPDNQALEQPHHSPGRPPVGKNEKSSQPKSAKIGRLSKANLDALNKDKIQQKPQHPYWKALLNGESSEKDSNDAKLDGPGISADAPTPCAADNRSKATQNYSSGLNRSEHVASKDETNKSSKQPRSTRNREALPPINVKALLTTTWETASAPTSVMSTTTRNKLANIIVPFESFDRTHSLLLEYCTKGKASAVRFLLQKGCNPGTKHQPRSGPLIAAIRGASARHNKCVRELIKYEVNVNVKSKKSKTPALHLAIENPTSNSYVKLVWLLVNAGADLDSFDQNGDSVLTKVFSGADLWPLQKHRLEALALLLQGGAQVNHHAPGTGNTPLHLAVRRKDKWAVAMLLYKGADVNAKNFSGSTPLQLTANQFRGDLSPGHAQVLDLLLQANASIDERAGALKRTALHLAVISGTAYAVRLLLEYGADPSLVDGHGKDALQLAIKEAEKLTSHQDRLDDHVEIMEQLGAALGMPWKIVKERSKGICAVEAASSPGNLDLLRALIVKGNLDGNTKFKGTKILSLAKNQGNSAAVEILRV